MTVGMSCTFCPPCVCVTKKVCIYTSYAYSMLMRANRHKTAVQGSLAYLSHHNFMPVHVYSMTYPIHTTDCHQWLLGEDVDILPSLLLPLAGPEEFSEEETDKLPEDLQYLPTDKAREGDPDIRKMLLQALTKV